LSAPLSALAAPRHAPLPGILCMVGGSACLILNDALMKWLTPHYPIGELVFLRGTLALCLIVGVAWLGGRTSQLRVRSWRIQGLRGGVMMVSAMLFITGLRYLPLAEAVAIAFTGPLFITAMAAPLLGERVGWRRWTAVLVGFAGVLVMLRPGSASWTAAALLPLGASLGAAIRDIITRRASASEHSLATLAVSTAMVSLAGLSSLLVVDWWMPAPRDIGILAGAAVFLGSAHFLLIEAFRHAEAAMVAPFKYSSLLWGLVLGFAVWGEWPDGWALGGAVLVVASGLYIWWRERKVARA